MAITIMIINKDFEKNTVPASEQVKEKFYKFEKPNPKLKILFLGNSITLHEPKPEIGWNFSHGMAATSPEKDYVHQVVKMIEDCVGDISFYVMNVGMWEQNHGNHELLLEYSSLIDFNPDIIVFRFCENVKKPTIPTLRNNLMSFYQEIAPKGKFLVVTDNFWEDQRIDSLIFDCCNQFHGHFVKINDLGYQDENKALGMTDNIGINVHPGDLGMKRIAERIFSPIKDIYLEKLSK